MRFFEPGAYLAATEDDLIKTTELLKLNALLSSTAFYSLKHHGAAFIYPVHHICRMIKNVLNVVEGLCNMVPALLNSPQPDLPDLTHGIINEIGAFVLNVVNAAFSLVTWFTRTTATLINHGYTSTQFEKALQHDDANESTVTSFFCNVLDYFTGGLGELLKTAEQTLMEQSLSM